MGDLIECNLVRIIHEWDEKMAKGIYYFSVQEADLKKIESLPMTLSGLLTFLCVLGVAIILFAGYNFMKLL